MVKQLYNFLRNRYLIKFNPIKYAIENGVVLNGKLYMYGARVGMFGSEPWLITLGDNVHITGNCQFITHDGSTLILRDKYPDFELTFPINIGNNVYIGYGSTILPGVTIGDNVIIGAGSVVNKDIPSNSVAAGIPCKVIRTIDEYLHRTLPKSLKLGHLKGNEKDLELRKIYGK